MIKIKPALSIIAAVVVINLVACSKDKPVEIIPPVIVVEPEVESVKIEYTSYGVPHITADNLYGVAYGQAYAHAQENMCTLAEQIIETRSEKAKLFGSGKNNSNVISDLGFQALNIMAQSENSIASLTEEHTELLAGYVDGFNQAVTDKAGSDNYPTPCQGADWIPEITTVDLHAYHIKLALFASGGALIRQISAAAPLEEAQGLTAIITHISNVNKSLGSNGWALGSEKTESGKGMLLANPHFPWSGPLRFFENHLKIPNELNVTGASFVGVPGVLIGFNQDVAWTHTVSQSKRLSTYILTLDPQDPTRYLYDGDYKEMTSEEYTVEVKNDDGSFSNVTKTLYSSHYGPMIGWNPNNTALTYRDANVGNTNIVSQWLAINKATSVADIESSIELYQGIPWVNVIATDKEANAYFIDASKAPNLTAQADAIVKQYVTLDPTGKALWKGGRGQLLLDGSNSIFEWEDSGQTSVAGVVPFDKAPKVTRQDYVYNANSSHWLNHVSEPLEGYSIVFGPEKTIRSPRTRLNAKMITEKVATGISGSDGKFNIAELKNVVMSQRGMLSELIKDQVVTRCNGITEIKLTEANSINISPTCKVIEDWDGIYKNDSVGAHVFREFLKEFDTKDEKALSNLLFENAFNVDEPIQTPSQLKGFIGDINEDPILVALASVTHHLAEQNIPLAAPLSDLQYHLKNGEKIAIPGGITVDGVFNINSGSSAKVTSLGYQVRHGASWLMALEFTDEGPVAEAFLTYSQSHDPESEHYADQTHLFSTGQWRSVLFTEQQIQDDLKSTVELTLD